MISRLNISTIYVEFTMKYDHVLVKFHGSVAWMIHRTALLAAIRAALGRSHVVVLVGPRQSGKTTLAREFLSEDSPNYFDLEDPSSLARLDEPMTALAPLEGLVVIDEIQRRPELFPILRILLDRSRGSARFLILSSTTGQLLHQTFESLAGRMERLAMGGLSLQEVGASSEAALWLRGGMPLAYLADSETNSIAWRKSFIQTLAERDLPAWGVRIPSATVQRFWALLAHCHGQAWNAAEPARTLSVSLSTMRRYLDLLTDAFMVRQLSPYLANVNKRQVKAPKIFVRDTGLLHRLLGIDSLKNLLTHPKMGASWEGFVMEQVLATQPYDEAYFWATHQGAEMDLVLVYQGELYGIEFNRRDAPRMTPSIRIAQQDLGLKRVFVLYPGVKRDKIADDVEVVPVAALAEMGGLWGE